MRRTLNVVYPTSEVHKRVSIFISLESAMRNVIGIFFEARGTSPWLVLGCLLLASIASGIGLASLLPLLSLATESGPSAQTSAITEFLSEFLALFNGKPDLVTLIFVLLAAIAVKGLLTVFAMRYVGKAIAEVSAGMRSALIKGLLNVRWGFFTTRPLGRFLNATSIEASNAGKAYDMSSQFLANTIQSAVYVIIALFISWKLAALAVVMAASVAYSLRFLVRMSKRAGYRQNKRTRELLIYLTDALNSIRPLKAMARQDGFAKLFDDKIEVLRKVIVRQILSLEGRRALEEFLFTACMAATFYCAVVIWSLQISDVLVLGLLLFRTMSHVGKMQELYQKVVLLESPYRSLRELIAETKAERESTGGNRLPSLDKCCRFEGINFAYGENAVLKDVTFEIPARQVTVLTGASGGGKTTITDLLLGLQHPDSGEILLDGVPLETIDLQRWRQMIGYVPQELVLFHDTVFANVGLGDEQVTEADVRAALERVDAWEFVSAMPNGMMSSVGEKGTMLSGGQRQRIALARALATKPRVLILDEVSSALDPGTEQVICQLIRNLAQTITILSITHRPAFLEIADRIYHVENGFVIRAGDTVPFVAASPR